VGQNREFEKRNELRRMAANRRVAQHSYYLAPTFDYDESVSSVDIDIILSSHTEKMINKSRY
jgi:hypothetical protein